MKRWQEMTFGTTWGWPFLPRKAQREQDRYLRCVHTPLTAHRDEINTPNTPNKRKWLWKTPIVPTAHLLSTEEFLFFLNTGDHGLLFPFALFPLFQRYPTVPLSCTGQDKSRQQRDLPPHKYYNPNKTSNDLRLILNWNTFHVWLTRKRNLVISPPLQGE